MTTETRGTEVGGQKLRIEPFFKLKSSTPSETTSRSRQKNKSVEKLSAGEHSVILDYGGGCFMTGFLRPLCDALWSVPDSLQSPDWGCMMDISGSSSACIHGIEL